ncbi:MAG TPA: PilZ domain-containing protein [Vicinamibacteria bacterium]|jgi:hypothetical protein
MPRAASRSVGEGIPSEAVLRRIRIPFVQRVAFVCRGESEELFAVDLGLRGIFVERAEVLPRGETADVQFRLPGNEIPVVVRCRVAWSHQPGGTLASKRLPPGVGLEFVEASDRDLTRLREHLLEYLRGHHRLRRFERDWPEGEEDR